LLFVLVLVLRHQKQIRGIDLVSFAIFCVLVSHLRPKSHTCHTCHICHNNDNICHRIQLCYCPKANINFPTGNTVYVGKRKRTHLERHISHCECNPTCGVKWISAVHINLYRQGTWHQRHRLASKESLK
jgi:hypothetical protein